jgi:hypothetical protein
MSYQWGIIAWSDAVGRKGDSAHLIAAIPAMLQPSRASRLNASNLVLVNAKTSVNSLHFAISVLVASSFGTNWTQGGMFWGVAHT